ncbi:MAG: flagellar basal body protein FliL [Spirochaetaceae bacterium]|jgi:flagellar basal body-associated protein FliL|nr:flagellar basal body protein FliL [Spirochaetaceae bacterium]
MKKRIFPGGPVPAGSGKTVAPGDSSVPDGGPVPRLWQILYRTLLVLALALGLGILGGTLFAVFRGAGLPGNRAAPGEPGTEAAGEPVFTGIGRLRIPLSPPEGAAGEGRAALVISIAFPYSPRDRAFSEELAARVGDFRRIAREYFSSRSVEEFRAGTEETMKAELLGAYNSALRLGKIRTLYFNDLLLFE